jgi:4'-phosphopantetheinyl transferase
VPEPASPPSSGPPDGSRVVWHSSGITSVPADDAWLTPRERAWVERMRFEKRRSEFRLGRFNAKQSLARHLGLDPTPATLSRIEIDRAPDGAPAPLLDRSAAQVSLSMTDRADWAVCVLGPPRLGLGCDLELVEPRSDAFVRDYLTTAERTWVASASGEAECHLRANLVWCAKESALKVLRTGLRRDTRSVEMSPGAGADDAIASDWRPLLVRAREGRHFPGWWRHFGDFLLVVAADGPFSPPLPLVEPPPLATAQPTHSWWSPPRTP